MPPKAVTYTMLGVMFAFDISLSLFTPLLAGSMLIILVMDAIFMQFTGKKLIALLTILWEAYTIINFGVNAELQGYTVLISSVTEGNIAWTYTGWVVFFMVGSFVIEWILFGVSILINKYLNRIKFFNRFGGMHY